MLKIKNVKIKYYALYKKYWNNLSNECKAGVRDPFLDLPDILDFIIKKTSRNKRKIELKSTEKVIALDKFELIEKSKLTSLYFGTFISADSNYRPNLINRNTLKERKNPKEREEGDKETTYFMLKIIEGEIYFFLQDNYKGVTIKQVLEVFRFYVKEIYMKEKGGNTKFSLQYDSILKDDFLKEINRMGRIKDLIIYADKKILGSHFLDFSDRIIPVKETIGVLVTAEKGLNVKSCAIDAFNKLNSTKTPNSIRRIKAMGFDRFGASSILDTEKMLKIESLEADLNLNTGEISFSTFKRKMISLVKSF